MYLPVIMDLNPANGRPNKFISLDLMQYNAEVLPNYKTFGAIYYDNRDFLDNSPYFYTALIKDNLMFMLRVKDEPNRYRRLEQAI
jgi:hypothetical protein